MEPEQRRDKVMKIIQGQYRTSRSSAYKVIPISLMFIVASLFFWEKVYQRSLLSSLGAIAGAIFASIFYYLFMKLNKIKVSEKIFSDTFSDNDVELYFLQHEEVNRIFLKSWRSWGASISFLLFAVLIFTLLIESARPFSYMFLFVGLAVLLSQMIISSFVNFFRIKIYKDRK